MKFLAFFVTGLLLTSCAGYRLGGIKPASLQQVKRIAVPMFSNATLHPRAEAIATSSVANALVLDGTYQLSEVDQADAILDGKISSISYYNIRGSRLDTQLPEELANMVILEWHLKDARDPTRILASGSSAGNSQMFVGSNLQTARNNALPEALERAGETLVSRLANGY